MSRLLGWLIFASALCMLCNSTAHAQTINASSCNRSDVQTAVNSVNQTTAIVNIPACAANHWTGSTPLTITVPSNNTSLTIQGATVCTGTGDPAQNNLACTDNTTITNDLNSGLAFIVITTNSNTASVVRITGFTFNAGTDNVGFNGPDGAILVSGSSQNVRFDHNHFNMNANPSWTGSQIGVNGCVYGVIDHNVFNADQIGAINLIIFMNGESCGGDSLGVGDVEWTLPTNFGSNQFMYVEQNRFNMALGSAVLGEMNDCIEGGKYVYRFNSLVNGHFQTHPTGGSPRHRGCRALEIYHNTSTSTGGSGSISTNMFFSSGPALYWGNTLATNAWSSFIALKNCRQGNLCGYGPPAPPNGWGFCGTVGGGPSGFDGNSNSSTGYPCIDQPARGQGDLLTGQFPPQGGSGICDQTTGCTTYNGTWPRQLLEPSYIWLNSVNTAATALVDNCCTNTTQNQDYFISSDPGSGTDCAGFTGATGVGCGTLANRPATCTAGPGGTYGQSPTGSYGVGYWATDQGNWNTSGNGTGSGVLYVCTATNTWTAVYTPLTYPHALTNGQSSSGTSLTAPTNLQVTVN